MKYPILMACAMMAALTTSVLAQGAAAGGAAGGTAKTERAKHPKMTEEQKAALIDKKLEEIKAKDEAQYKELIALKAKDPEAFKAKMHELIKADHAKAKGPKAAAATK